MRSGAVLGDEDGFVVLPAPGDIEPEGWMPSTEVTIPGLFRERSLVVVSNRQPYEQSWSDAPQTAFATRRPAGGLTSALDPVMRAVGGTWVAWGSGRADPAAADLGGRVGVPPEAPAYTLRRVWLSDHDLYRYYLGYSNQLLWPLCHLRPDLMRIRAADWERYRQVNRRFADATLEEVEGSSAAVWFQDYQLALAPAMVREARPELTLSHFWHIPFPPVDVFRLAPQAEAIVRGLLANDLLGFHTARYGRNFLAAAEELAGARVDARAGTALLDGHLCRVGAFPISVDAGAMAAAARGPEAGVALDAWRARFAPPGRRIGLGVDRMDYSKGIPEKLDALAQLWERHPEHRGHFTFVQVAVPSRAEIEAYGALARQVERRVRDLNERYGSPGWTPVHLIQEALPVEQLAPLYRLADLCLVGSLQDGMNLVAKEYVACQAGGAGVLVLSEFTGAAEQLGEGAVLVNPYDPESTADRLHRALTLPEAERRARMQRLGAMPDIYAWLSAYLARWAEVVAGTRPPERAAAG